MAEIISRSLEQALVKHGLVPPECRLLEVVMAPMSAVIVRYEVFLTVDQMRLFALAFAESSDTPKKDEQP
jgi:hypothetical protein